MPLVPILVDWLRSTNRQVVSVGIMGLGEIGLWPQLSVPALTNKLNDPAVRRDVIEALGSFEKDAVAAVPHLIGFLQDTNSEIVAAAASALGDIGDKAETVVPALANTLVQHSNQLVRAAAAGARPLKPVVCSRPRGQDSRFPVAGAAVPHRGRSKERPREA